MSPKNKVDHRTGALRGIWVRLAKEITKEEKKHCSPSAAKMRFRRKNSTARRLYEKEIRRAEKVEASIELVLSRIGAIAKNSNRVSA